MKPNKIWKLISSENNVKTYKVNEAYVTVQMNYDPVCGLSFEKKFVQNMKGEQK